MKAITENAQVAQTGTKTDSVANTHCSVCRGKNAEKRDAINRALGKGISYRDIEAMTGVSYRTIGNHAQHLPAVYREAKEKDILSQTIDHQAEIEQQFRFARNLRIAAERYLSDPESGELTLIPRADEITVIYKDYCDTTPKGEPKRKRDTLSKLLERAEAANIKAVQTVIKHVDIRSFGLEAIKAADLVLDKVARVEGRYEKDNRQKNPPAEEQPRSEQAWNFYQISVEFNEKKLEPGEQPMTLAQHLEGLAFYYPDQVEFFKEKLIGSGEKEG